MGMPLNNFSIIYKLSEHNPRDYDYQFIQSALNTFNIYAFVIHDPAYHIKFHEHLCNVFVQLDEQTGEKLLFFPLIDHPSSWINNVAVHRTYFKKLGGSFFNQEYSISPEKLSISILKLCSDLNIRYDELPVIIYTNSLNGFSFIKEQTNELLLKLQLLELGWIAKDIEKDNHNMRSSEVLEQVYHKFARSLNPLKQKLNKIILQSKIVDSLLPVMSAVFQASTGTHAYHYNDASRINLQNIKVTLDQIRAIKESINLDRESGEIEQLCNKIVSQLSTTLAILNRNSRSFLLPYRRHLDQECQILLDTGLNCFKFIANQNKIRANTLDYTPASIALAKIFEKEINFSIIHWAREMINVRLPKFYMKYDPGVGCHTLNERLTDGSWHEPELGTGLYNYRNFLRTNIYPPTLNRRLSYKLKDYWTQIRNYRNVAAHSISVPRTNTVDILTKYKELNNMGLFQKFYDLKRIYRGS